MSLIDSIKFDVHGLMPTVAQDALSGQVLMVAWMNRESFEATLETGYAHYYSRSRKKLWKKGESSGHVQKVLEMYLDCDRDTLLLKIEQTGPACHTNRISCFYHQRQGENWQIIADPLK